MGSMISLQRMVPLFAGVLVASTAAFAANTVQQVTYKGSDDSFSVLTTVEGFTPADHKQVVGVYQKHGQLVFVPVDFTVRMFEGTIKPINLQDSHWTGFGSDDSGLASKVTTRPGQLFPSGDLLSYYQETVVPGVVVDEMLRAYRGPLMDKDAIDAEVARREAGETMKLWSDFKGLGQDNPLQFMNFVSLRMLGEAAGAAGAAWTRNGEIAQCLVPMTNEDARDMKRACEWWLAESRRDHSYQGQLTRAFASTFQTSCHLTPILNEGMRFMVDIPDSTEAFSKQMALQSDTRGGEILGASQDYLRFANYKAMTEMLAADTELEVNWAIRDRDSLVKRYESGDLRFSTKPGQK